MRALKRAQDAGALVARARQGAENSGEVVQNAVKAMEQMEKSSVETPTNGVIDDIAFQTNLLALNAGVEAARGTRGQQMVHLFDNESQAVSLFLEVLREKRKRGYRPKDLWTSSGSDPRPNRHRWQSSQKLTRTLFDNEMRGIPGPPQ
jgi:hypothetical protein